MDLLEQLKNLSLEDRVIVSVDKDVTDTMALLIFQETSLQKTLEAVRENRYGFYDRTSVVNILTQIEDKRVERENFIKSVGEALLGENYSEILNDLGVAFQIDTALPVIVFFRVK